MLMERILEFIALLGLKNKMSEESLNNEVSKNRKFDRDTVCGEYINIDKAIGMSIYKNETYYFCCKICKKLFDENPSAYADKEERYFDPNNPNDFTFGTFRIL